MPHDPQFRFLAIAVLAGFVAVRVAGFLMAGVAGRRDTVHREPPAFFLVLLASVFLGVLPLMPFLAGGEHVSWATFPAVDELRWLGVVIGVGAVALFAWAHWSLGRHFSPLLRVRNDHALVRSGPYRWIRHPIYTSGFLLFTGLGLMAASWPTVLGAVALLATMSTLRIPREEAQLTAQFGEEYRTYMGKTGRVFPRFRRS